MHSHIKEESNPGSEHGGGGLPGTALAQESNQLGWLLRRIPRVRHHKNSISTSRPMSSSRRKAKRTSGRVSGGSDTGKGRGQRQQSHTTEVRGKGLRSEDGKNLLRSGSREPCLDRFGMEGDGFTAPLKQPVRFDQPIIL